jgi:hypothetical protein
MWSLKRDGSSEIVASPSPAIDYGDQADNGMQPQMHDRKDSSDSKLTACRQV